MDKDNQIVDSKDKPVEKDFAEILSEIFPSPKKMTNVLIIVLMCSIITFSYLSFQFKGVN